jgi:phage tail sheath gpL-like
MAAGSITININPSSAVTMADRTANIVSDRKQDCLQQLKQMIEDVQSGISLDVIKVQYNSSVDPVFASGTITVTNTSVDADDTVTIAGTVLTAKASGANGTSQFNKGVSSTATATNLAACINANTTLNKFVVASSSSAVVTVTCLVPGTIGNLISLATSDAPAFALSAAVLASGAGGVSQSPVTF